MVKENISFSYMDTSTILIHNSVCALLINMYVVFKMFPLRIMFLGNNWVDVALDKGLEERFSAFHMGIFRSDVGWCIVFTNESSHIISPLDICWHSKDRPKKGFLVIEHLVTAFTPYIFGESKKVSVEYSSMSLEQFIWVNQDLKWCLYDIQIVFMKSGW